MRELAIGVDQGGQVVPIGGEVPVGGLSTGIVEAIFRNGFTILLILAVSLSLIFLVWSAIQYIISGGDKNKVAAARSRITWTIIGLVISLLAFLIISAISYIFKIDLLNFQYQYNN